MKSRAHKEKCKNRREFWMETLKRKRYLEEPDVDGRIAY
jgi:hypothetical protein